MTARMAVLAVVQSGCSLMGFYEELPTRCPDDPSCCSEGDPLAHDGCDWTCNDPLAPDFKLASLEVTPGAPESTLLRAALEGAVAEGGMVWLIDLDREAGSTTFRTGTGTCGEAGPCELDDGYPPAEGLATLGEEGRLSLPTTGHFETTVVIDAADLGAPFPLRLRECTLVGPVEASGNCIGRRQGDSPADWSTPARIACKISVTDAREVDLTTPNLTLCDLLASCGDLFCCDDPQPSWPEPPDDEADGSPAWRLQADVAAIGVRISD